MVNSEMPIEDGYSTNVSVPIKIEGNKITLTLNNQDFLNKMREYIDFIQNSVNVGRAGVEYRIPKLTLEAELGNCYILGIGNTVIKKNTWEVPMTEYEFIFDTKDITLSFEK